jgi:hypothetical protein
LKIVIQNSEPIRLYHHPRDVSVHPQSKIVKTFNEDGSLLETFKLVKKETSWCEDLDSDHSEILVTLHVEH